MKVMCAEVIGDIIELFEENFATIPPFQETDFELALKGIKEYYRRSLSQVKMDLKTKIIQFLSDFDFEYDLEDLTTLTLDTWSEMFEATRPTASLKQQISQVKGDYWQLKQAYENQDTKIHELNLQITRLECECSRQQTEASNLAHSNAELKQELERTKSQSVKAAYRFSLLQSDYDIVNSELKERIRAEAELRRQILKKRDPERGDNFGDDQIYS